MFGHRVSGVAMRPNKEINPGASSSGTAATRKGRYYTTDLPTRPEPASEPPTGPDADPPGYQAPVASKYTARASVRPELDEPTQPEAAEPDEDWTDPLDQEDELDLTTVTIDLRDTLVENPPETYYQRYSSRVPDHQ